MNDISIDWDRLGRLRRLFLEGSAGRQDYWESAMDLASYDATFAQRIGWKWDFVLEDLKQRGWCPPNGEVLDWGCGTGIASRAFLDHFGTGAVTRLLLHDRSESAMAYAQGRAGEKFPGIEVVKEALPVVKGGVVLISHVLTELAPPQVERLVELLRRAESVLWVEPGTYEASIALIAVRERLREMLHPVAPCVHAGPCGILAPSNEAHWCHHFAQPPREIFTDPFWGRFARLLEIDMGTVPLSYLVLDQRPPPPVPSGGLRVLGRPRLNKGCLRVLTCDASGVRERERPRRTYPEEYRLARKDRYASFQIW